MDGFNTSEQVVCACRHQPADILDKALDAARPLRPHIHIDRPTMKRPARISSKLHLAKIATKEDMDYLTGRHGL